MKWWQRLIFSVISAGAGFFSLDLLYNAFVRLAGLKGTGSIVSQELPIRSGQFTGALMFIGWLAAFGFYCILIIRLSPGADIMENDPKTGKNKMHFKWADLIAQIIIILAGMMIRWLVVSLFLLPV